MFIFRVILAFTTLFSLSWGALRHNDYQQSLSLSQDDLVSFRDATPADIDDITTVFVDAFAPSALWRYAWPNHGNFTAYRWYCARQDLASSLFNKTNVWVKVISVTDKAFRDKMEPIEIREKREERVVAFAVWVEIKQDSKAVNNGIFKQKVDDNEDSCHRPGVNRYSRISSTMNLDLRENFLTDSKDHPEYNCSAHLYINQTRANDFQEQFNAYQKKYVVDAYPDQLYLALLATHPTWDGHGFGARHCRWGMDFAKRTLGVPVTLIASPAGFPLYDSLGFESVANMTMRMLDSLGKLWFEVMRWNVSSVELER